MQNNEQQPGSLQDRFSQFGAEPTDKLWREIERGLDNNRRRKGFLFWWIGGFTTTAAIAVLLIARLSGERSNDPSANRSQTKTEQTAATKSAHKTPQSNKNQQTTQVYSGEKSTNNATEITSKLSQNSKQKRNAPSSGNNTAVREKSNYPIETASMQEIQFQAFEQVPAAIDHTDSLTAQTIDTTQLPRVPSLNAPSESTKSVTNHLRKGKWLIGIHTGFWEAKKDELFVEPAPSSLTDPSEAYSLASGSINYGTPYRHLWSLGIGIGRQLRPRLLVESGLDFQCFSTGLVDNIPSYQSGLIRTWTVGIPLDFSYDFAVRRRMTFFASTGLRFDFPYRKYATLLPTSANLESSTSSGFPSPANSRILAIQLGAGARFHLARSFYLELKPTVRYNFLQHNAPFATRNWWWGINAGLIYRL